MSTSTIHAFIHIRSIPDNCTSGVKSPQFATFGLVTSEQLDRIIDRIGGDENDECLDRYNQHVKLELVKTITDPKTIQILTDFHGERYHVGHIDLIGHLLEAFGDGDEDN